MKDGKTLWRDLRTLANQNSHGRWAISLEMRRSVVSSAIDQLPEGARMLLALRYYECLGFNELAEAIGQSPSDVKQVVSESIEKIYQDLIEAEERHLKGARE